MRNEAVAKCCSQMNNYAQTKNFYNGGGKMNAVQLYAFLQAEFGEELKTGTRRDGRAYYWREVSRSPYSSRVLRVSEGRDGAVTAIKRAQSSLAAGSDVLIPLPSTPHEIAAAVRDEISRIGDS